jgi:exonuclease III
MFNHHTNTLAQFICVTESHLNPSILDAEIAIPGYDLLRSDRKDRSHGGVAIYVRKDIAVKTCIQDSNTYSDSLILHIPQLNLVLINVYRPPGCPEILFNQTMEHAASFLRNLEEGNQCANTYLVMGDFNFPFLKAGMQDTNLSETQEEISAQRKVKPEH